MVSDGFQAQMRVLGSRARSEPKECWQMRYRLIASSALSRISGRGGVAGDVAATSRRGCKGSTGRRSLQSQESGLQALRRRVGKKKTAEIPQLQTVKKIGEIPQTQTIQGTQAPENLAITPVCQVRQTGHVEELVEVSKVFSQDTVRKQTIEIPAESASPIFVTASVLENSPVVVGSEQPAHVAEYMALAPTVSCTDAAVTHATRPLPATTMAVAHRLVDV